MFLEIKNRIEKELCRYIAAIEKNYRLKRLSPLLSNSIKEFISRSGKRVRPALFCIGYLGYAKRAPCGLYRSALSLELLHDFMLVHDDIIDKSDTRRGRPSMHEMLNRYLNKFKGLKFSGQDLTIVAGDVMFAMALDAFLAIKENPRRKEEALRKLIRAALHTGSGEFIELLLGAKPMEKVTRDDIYKIYDYKTANYTFSSPLAIGATLAGAKEGQIKKLFLYGTYLGRAFQIKDDIIGAFGKEAQTGKSALCDLREAKKTILIWYAYRNSPASRRLAIKKLLSGRITRSKDLESMRRVIADSGALDYAKDEIGRLIRKSAGIIRSLGMRNKYLRALDAFSRQTLAIKN